MTPATKRKCGDARCLRGQLKTARHIHGQLRDFSHHGPKAIAAKPFLEAIQHAFFIPAFNDDQPVLRKPGLRQRWHEKIWPGNAPEYLSLQPRCDTRTKQRGGRAIHYAVSPTAYLMQAAKFQPPTGQMVIDGGKPERQSLLLSGRTLGDPLQSFPQFLHDKLFGAFLHDTKLLRAFHAKNLMFTFCSNFRKESTSQNQTPVESLKIDAL